MLAPSAIPPPNRLASPHLPINRKLSSFGKNNSNAVWLRSGGVIMCGLAVAMFYRYIYIRIPGATACFSNLINLADAERFDCRSRKDDQTVTAYDNDPKVKTEAWKIVE